MNIILLFFVLPFATNIFSIVLQKILKCPVLVAAIFFAIYLILAYTVFGTDFLIFAIIYTILSYITAILTRLIMQLFRRINCTNSNSCCSNDSSNSNCLSPTTYTARIANQVSDPSTPVIYLTNTSNTMSRRNNCNCCNCCRRR